MSLKAVLASKAEVDALPEAVRAFYKEQGGKYTLDVDGMTPDSTVAEVNTKLSEFRENNVKLLKENGDLKTKFADVDPDRYKSLVQQEATFKQAGLNGPNDVSKAISEAVEKATKPLNDKLDGLAKERDDVQAKLTAKAFDDKLWEIGSKAGVDELYRQDFLTRGKATFKLDGDDLVPVDGKLSSKRKNAAHLPMTAEEWATEVMPTSAPGFFKENKGGGARNGKDRQLGAGVVANDPNAIGDNLEAIANGTMRVAGTAAA